MRLYTYYRSSAAFRVRIALNLKGLLYEPQFVHLARGEQRKSEYLAVNPQGLVPALVDEGQLLTQSLAIIEYLDETHRSPPLLPKDPLGRARVRSLALLVACEIHPLNNQRTLQYLVNELGHSDEEKNRWYQHWIRDGMAKLESDLARGGSGSFCYGDAPGMADCCLVPQVFNAQRFNCDLSHAPRVMRVFEQCMQLEAFQRAQPSRQPDAE
jgi:maleylacetoacetate isomerase/maleylpyruvate isomerase